MLRVTARSVPSLAARASVYDALLKEFRDVIAQQWLHVFCF
jgi:hypothetical protein